MRIWWLCLAVAYFLIAGLVGYVVDNRPYHRTITPILLGLGCISMVTGVCLIVVSVLTWK